jgi:hypothetical protein
MNGRKEQTGVSTFEIKLTVEQKSESSNDYLLDTFELKN